MKRQVAMILLQRVRLQPDLAKRWRIGEDSGNDPIAAGEAATLGTRGSSLYGPPEATMIPLRRVRPQPEHAVDKLRFALSAID